MSLHAGDTVTFINRDEVSHNLAECVTPESGNVLTDKGLQRPGGQTKITFSSPGIYRVRCSIWPANENVGERAIANRIRLRAYSPRNCVASHA